VLIDLQLIVIGAGIGLLISAPVGPVNVLAMQRTLERGYWGGVAAGLGAVLADGLIAAAAAFGVTAISGVMIAYSHQIQLIGGLILILFGTRQLFAKPSLAVSVNEKSRLVGNTGIIPQTFFLTITNPGAIIGISAILGSYGSAVGGFQGFAPAAIMTCAIMSGGIFWWMGLAWLIAIFRHRLDERRLRMVNQVAGLTLIFFGLLFFLKLAAPAV
jgi:threonine/homoserine/homoserine lactone efflux protein